MILDQQCMMLILMCSICVAVDLCKHLLGNTGYNVCVVSMLLFAYGAMLAYFVIIGDTVPVALDYFMGDGAAPSRNVVIVVAAVVPILPLSLMRNLSSLSYTSLLSITADVLLVLFIVLRGPSAAKEEDTQFQADQDINIFEYQLFEGIGTMSFAFVCQHNTFIVYNSMRNANLKRWRKVSHSSVFTSFILCLIMGLGGFLSFGSYTEGDVLNNFPETGTTEFAMRSMLIGSMCIPQWTILEILALLNYRSAYLGWTATSGFHNGVYLPT
jgi:sodium-coupled neutral amino acid transporter 11